MKTNRTKKILRIDQVVEWRLCMGCGACKYACGNKAITLIDIPACGIRPQVDDSKCQKCSKCVEFCPGIKISNHPINDKTISALRQTWGSVLEVWEGYAVNPEIRYKGSSGGAATALALFCLEEEQASGVLHIGVKPESPLQNIAVFSKSREELMVCTGSRYSPAAPCEKLNWIEESDGSCVFIGKPCDVAALRKLQVVKPSLNDKVGLAISIFCAGTPSTNGTISILDVLNVAQDKVAEIRYRGRGWPGKTIIKIKGSTDQKEMTYEDSWGGILSKYVPLRCRLCPDGTGELADISCGDPWYHEIKTDEPGRSLVLVRTERGRRVLQRAMEAGYIEMVKVSPRVLAASQKSLLNKRQNLFGRLLAMRLMGIPVPYFEGFSLFSNWRDLPVSGKARSIAGTIKRIVNRRWRKALPSINLFNAEVGKDACGIDSQNVRQK